jgi:hypothetical protein
MCRWGEAASDLWHIVSPVPHGRRARCIGSRCLKPVRRPTFTKVAKRVNRRMRLACARRSQALPRWSTITCRSSAFQARIREPGCTAVASPGLTLQVRIVPRSRASCGTLLIVFLRPAAAPFPFPSRPSRPAVPPYGPYPPPHSNLPSRPPGRRRSVGAGRRWTWRSASSSPFPRTGSPTKTASRTRAFVCTRWFPDRCDFSPRPAGWATGW